MKAGWIKLHREWLENPIITKDCEHLAVMIYLLSNASFEEREVMFGSKKIKLRAGQLLITRREIYEAMKIERNKVDRIMKAFKNEELIEEQTNMHKTLITLKLLGASQGKFAEPNAEPMTNQCRTEKEGEKEKEKRSKREKEKEGEIKKKERRGEVYMGKEDTNPTPLLTLGKYENVLASKEWLDSFKEKYSYYEEVIESLSRYKKAKGIENKDDTPYLEAFAEADKYRHGSTIESTFDADDFFACALARSYADDDEEDEEL